MGGTFETVPMAGRGLAGHKHPSDPEVKAAPRRHVGNFPTRGTFSAKSCSLRRSTPRNLQL
ncbi:hypothetical protein F8B43_2741 [Methylorubrum populi]|uniref:Uncharacterized protein n=1 Tax=Methylorubrum populi TaxID=223967 RepID=A0A833N049_9HYPH|nr:hypothetical protein F8B43_2741 [Methylorubrum populi]